MADRVAALAEVDRLNSENQRRQGYHEGAQEIGAAMVVHGYVTFMGKRVPVRFDWPDERTAVIAREHAIAVLKVAHEAGRQAEAPPSA